MFDKKNLNGDLFGGLTAAIVALPLALAFGVQSGMGAIAGLYGAIALGIFASMFGGTSTQISGPTGPMAVVAATVIATEIFHYGSLEAAMGSIVATFVLAGIFQILMGLFRIGNYITYMPYPVISGFMSGIGAIIIIMQIFPFFGIESPKSIVEIIKSLPLILEKLNIQALMLSIFTIIIIYLFPYITKKIPSALVALILLSIASYLLKLDIPIIGDIPKGFPEIHLDNILQVDWNNPMLIIIPALTLAALGAIDSLLTSVVADSMTKTQHESNKELIGQGIGNAMAGIIGGLPGAGATMRTVVNIKAGGKSRISGIVHGIILIIILFGAGEYASLIPLPVLAGILITVGIDIIDYKGISHIKEVPMSDAVVMIIVLVLTVFVDLLQAVGVGVVMACVLFMKQMSDTADSKSNINRLDEIHKIEGYNTEEEKALLNGIGSQVYIQEFEGPIFFGFTSKFKQKIREIPEVSVVILKMSNVPNIDQSGMYAIEEAVLELEKKNTTVIFLGLQQQPENMLKNIKLIPKIIPYSHVFKDLSATVDALRIHKEDEEDEEDEENKDEEKIINNIIWKK